MADPTQTPDLQGAGLPAGQQDQSGLMDALRTQGSVPATTVNPGLAFGSGMLAGLGGQQGNPYLAQQQQQQGQQIQQFVLMERIRSQRQAQAAQQQQHLLTIYDGLLRSQSPEARVVGGRGIEQLLKAAQQKVPAGFAESFRQEELTLDKRKQAYYAILAAKSDPVLSQNLPQYLETELHIPRSRHPQLIQEAQSPAIHKALFGKTPDQEQYEQAKAERDERRYELDLRKQDAREAQDAAKEVRDDRRIDLAERNALTAERRLELAQSKFEWQHAKGPEEKRLKALDQADLLASQLDSTAALLNKGGYLPDPGAGVLSPSYIRAKANRVGFPNDPAWQLWVRHLQPAMVGYARSVQNDIGPRAMAAFQGALLLMGDPPDERSIQEVVRNMRVAIKLGREGKDTAQNLFIKHPDGSVERVPWKRGMDYAPGDRILRIE